MKPDWIHTIEGLLQDWKVCCLQETKAIQSQNWNEIQHIQRSIQDIMATIETITLHDARNGETIRQWLVPQMTELLDLERANAQNLGAKLDRTRNELDRSRTSGRNLNQIKSAYGANRDSVMIHRYT